jgi:hypothetical protein
VQEELVHVRGGGWGSPAKCHYSFYFSKQLANFLNVELDFL